MTKASPPSERGLTREETIIEWFQRNSRKLIIAVAVLALGAGAYWFYTRSIQIKNQNAESALNTALQSVQAGNKALASSDLQKVVSRYPDTQSGVEAGLLLAEMDFDDGRITPGLTVLNGLAQSSAGKLELATIYSLMGDGELQANKPSDAAKSYAKAAEATTYDLNKAYQRSKQAQALAMAGDTAAAVAIWKSLAADPKAAGVGVEAQVRLGQMEAKAEPKG